MDRRATASASQSLPPSGAKPELLAPAGDADALSAAVEHGADAVYFGLTSGLNARARAANFAPADLPGIMAELHRRGVKGYVTLNTLVFSDELPVLEQTVRVVADAGVDAVLVQDFGAARLVRAICPELPLHASTQMTLTSAESIDVARSLGLSRVVLARELSLAEIAAIRTQTPLSLEVFVHGALCVSYSGQCLASLSLGGRSANRGQCAQACRLPYDLQDGPRPGKAARGKYPLSPADLAAFDRLPQLIAAGVDALKIEGRLKSPAYVAAVTRFYREVIDAVAAGHSDAGLAPPAAVEATYSRGFCHGWLDGPRPRQLLPGDMPAKRGTLLGTVVAVTPRRIGVRLAATVRRGDGVALPGADPAAAQGGRVYAIFRNGKSLAEAGPGNTVELAFARGAIRANQVQPGGEIWKTDDPHATRHMQRDLAASESGGRVDVDVCVTAAVGRRLVIEAVAATGARARVESAEPLAAAERHTLTPESLRAQLSRLGGTIYRLGRVQAQIDAGPMVPLSVLSQLRREMLRQLDAGPPRRSWAVVAAPTLPTLQAAAAAPTARDVSSVTTSGDAKSPCLHVLCRTLDQMAELSRAADVRLTADLPDLDACRDALAIARRAGVAIALATPRIQKPFELEIFDQLAAYAPDGVLVRNLGGLRFFRGRKTRPVADYTLNAANELSVDWLCREGCVRVTAALDLSAERAEALASHVPPEQLEAVLHLHVPMFHSEHCLFCAHRSRGNDRRDCGRACRRGTLRLRDRKGIEHLVVADAGCRNTVFHGVPQSALAAVPRWLRAGIRHFRIELSPDAPPELAHRLVVLYRELLAGQLPSSAAWRELATITPGVIRPPRQPTARQP